MPLPYDARGHQPVVCTQCQRRNGALSAFTTTSWDFGSPRLGAINGVPSMNIQGEGCPGSKHGVAMQAMEELIAKLPAGVGYSGQACPTKSAFQVRKPLIAEHFAASGVLVLGRLV